MDQRGHDETSDRTSQANEAESSRPQALRDLPAKPAEGEAVKGGWGRSRRFAADAG